MDGLLGLLIGVGAFLAGCIAGVMMHTDTTTRDCETMHQFRYNDSAYECHLVLKPQ